eukprot:CAMPEP_0117621990 /NCGR_PEP_ID=MMETSP0784-20121206/87914_1 /TAXON_ID=39447 /ORGANISM="" /LENGTH=40 /DNA_ID= /DNA_START= /DNA_END= /DNA_ORIENTATION=
MTTSPLVVTCTFAYFKPLLRASTSFKRAFSAKIAPFILAG